MRKKKQPSVLKKTMMRFIIIYMIMTSVVGSFFVFSLFTESILNEKVESKGPSPYIDVTFDIYPEPTGSITDFKDINDRLVKETEEIFLVNGTKHNQTFITEIVLKDVNNTKVKAYFESDNHTINLDMFFIAWDENVYKAILAHELFHAALHFKSYNDTNFIYVYEDLWSKQIQEVLADAYSFMLEPESYILLYNYYGRGENEDMITKELIGTPEKARCLEGPFRKLSPDITKLLLDIQNSCDINIQARLVNNTATYYDLVPDTFDSNIIKEVK